MVGDKVTIHLNDELVVDNVTLENFWERDKPIYPTGQIELQVRCSEIVTKGVALAHKGSWPRLERGASNINTLNSGEHSDMGESSSVHGTLVRIAAT